LQKAQTTVKKSDLNPVWNEVLKLSVPQNYGPLKLVSLTKIIFTIEITLLLSNALNFSEAKYIIIVMNYNTLVMAAIYFSTFLMSIFPDFSQKIINGVKQLERHLNSITSNVSHDKTYW
jgi:hypothetical protein